MVQSVGGGQRAFCLKGRGHRAGGRNGKRGREEGNSEIFASLVALAKAEGERGNWR